MSCTSKWRMPMMRLPASRADREGFWQQLVEGLPFGYAGLELVGLGAQLFVREGDHLLFEGS